MGRGCQRSRQREREQGPRALLNLGHTFGHALEALITPLPSGGLAERAAAYLGIKGGFNGFLKWVLDFIINRIDLAPFKVLVEQLVDALGGFLSAQQFVDLLKTVLQFFSGLFTSADGFTASVTDFIDKLPLIGPIVADAAVIAAAVSAS